MRQTVAISNALLGINRLMQPAQHFAVQSQQNAEKCSALPGSELFDGAHAHADALADTQLLITARHLLCQPPQALALQVADAVVRRSPSASACNRHQMLCVYVTYVEPVTVLYRTLKQGKALTVKPAYVSGSYGAREHRSKRVGDPDVGRQSSPACASNCEQLTTSPQHWHRIPETLLGAVSMTTVPVSSTSPAEVRYSTCSPSCKRVQRAACQPVLPFDAMEGS